MTNIVERARVFATAAHAAVGQTRKYTGEPYVVHPMEVASLVESVGGTEAMVAAAREHYVDECENDHGIPVSPVVRSAILEGTPVAVGDVRRLSESVSPAPASRRSPPPIIPPLTIPSRRG